MSLHGVQAAERTAYLCKKCAGGGLHCPHWLHLAVRVCRLEVVDESAQHAGHAGARETDSPSGETHFRVALVSPEFEGLPTIKRHRLVYQARACVCRVGIRVGD